MLRHTDDKSQSREPLEGQLLAALSNCVEELLSVDVPMDRGGAVSASTAAMISSHAQELRCPAAFTSSKQR